MAAAVIRTSQNRWPVYTSGSHSDLVVLPRVTGRVRGGSVATILGYISDEFHKRVEPVRKDWSWGYAYRPIRNATSGYSNHASATAIDLNAPEHPLGARNTFSAAQVREIRKILAEVGGLVRWGGDYFSRGDEMHFEINVPPSDPRLTLVAAALKSSTPVVPYVPSATGAFNMSDAQYKAIMGELSAIKTATATAFGPLGGRQYINEHNRTTTAAVWNQPIIRASGNTAMIQEIANQTKVLAEIKAQNAATLKVIEQLASKGSVDMAAVAKAAADAADAALVNLKTDMEGQLEGLEMSLRMSLTEALSEIPTADPKVFVDGVLARFHELTSALSKEG